MKKTLINLNRADKILLFAALLSGVVFSFEFIWPHPLERTILANEAGTPTRAKAALAGFEPGIAQGLGSIAERPLFTMDRRPYELPIPLSEQSIEPDPPAKPTADFTLSAIVMTPARRMALLNSGTMEETVKLSSGDAYQGWTLTNVEKGSATFLNGTETITLALQPQRDLDNPAGVRRHDR
jgi:hypothetical protein